VSRILIRGGTLIVPAGQEGVKSLAGDVLVEDQAILAVGDCSSHLEGGAPCQVLDARDMAVMPGLVNSHCHAAMALLRGYADDMQLMPWLERKIWPIEAHLTPEDVYWGTLLACAEMLKGGITCFADMYFHMHEVARAVNEVGMRAMLSLGLIGVGPNAQPDLDRSRVFFGTWHGAAQDRIRVQLGPHAPFTCPPPYLAQVMDLSNELGAGIHIHIAETRPEVDQVQEQHGMSPVTYALEHGIFEAPHVLAAHCVHLTPEDFDALTGKRVGVAHCPISNQKLASGLAPVPGLLAGGIPLGLGTDGAASTNQLNLWEEMRFAGYMQKVIAGDASLLPAGSLLYLATSGGASAVGYHDAGRLVPGARADLILVDLSALHLQPGHDVLSLLAHSARPADVHTVLVNGRVVVKAGRLQTVDEEEIVRNARLRAASLLERAGL